MEPLPKLPGWLVMLATIFGVICRLLVFVLLPIVLLIWLWQQVFGEP